LAVTTPKSTSLIDSIGAGYRLLNKRLWVLLIPLALDVYLLLGTPINLAPLLGPALGELRAQLNTLRAGATPEQLTTIERLDEFAQTAGRSDVRGRFALLNWLPVFVVDTAAPTAGQGSYAIASVRGMLGLFLLINALVLGLSGLFLAPLALDVRGADLNVQSWLRTAGRFALGVLVYVGLLLGAAVTIGLPFLLAVVLIGMLGPEAALLTGLLLGVLLQMLVFWLYLYCGFAIEALLLDEVGPLRAIRRSFGMVRRHFWGALGLIVLAFIITQGTRVIWSSVGNSVAGLLGGTLGTAYIGGGLAAARMIFYFERSRLQVQR